MIRSAANLRIISYHVQVCKALLQYGNRTASSNRMWQFPFQSGNGSPFQITFHADIRWFTSHSRQIAITRRIHFCVSTPQESPGRVIVNQNVSEDQDIHSIDGREGSDGNKRLRGGGFVRGDHLKWRKNPKRVKQLRFAKHITNLVRKGKVEEAEEVLGYMRGKGVKPEVAVFNTILAGLGRKGEIIHAFKIFNNMKKTGVLPTDHTYTSLFTACAQAGPKSLVQLTRIRAEIERREVLLNNIATNALISALASCEQPKEAYQVYLDMLKLSLQPDIQTFGSLLLAATKDSETGVDLAQRIWAEMLASGFQPDLHSYNLLLQCLRDAGVPESLRQPAEVGEKKIVFKIAETEGGIVNDQKRNRTTSARGNGEKNAVYSVEAKWQVKLSLSQSLRITLFLGNRELRWVGQEDVERLLGAMGKGELKPDIRTFHLLASLTLDCGNYFKQMKGQGIAPDNRFMATAIRMQTQLGNMKGAKALLQSAEERGLQMGQLGYQALATGCTSQKQGLRLLEEMKASDVRPNEYVFGTLMGNAARLKKYQYLTVIMKEMRHLEVLPNRTISDMLHKMASEQPKRSRLKTRYNGFKGYYELWKRTMSVD